MSQFDDLRERFASFLYRGVDMERRDGAYHVTFHYSIPGLSDFAPEWEFPIGISQVDEGLLRELFFHLGMAETISYYKCACPKIVEVQCGGLSGEQCAWWKKLYYNGLGEFLYRNGIVVSEADLMEIRCQKEAHGPLHDGHSYGGCLVPVGGGKDSVVSLELLKGEKLTTYSINAGSAIQNVIDICRHKQGDYHAKRTLDARMLALNGQGYLNGHIPFSAVVAFSAVIAAYLSGNRYIALSNETSANESTVQDSTVNHQYSKSFEFERDFAWYVKTVTDSDIHYFSLLRPLTELQIAWLFSKCKDYHAAFRSCNAGSKRGIWCCACPKCLFVYIILSPFLTEDELGAIFGERLLHKESLEKDFRELTGLAENKPFECVGTRREVLAALRHFVKQGRRSFLTDKYKEWLLAGEDETEAMLTEWVGENLVPEAYQRILKDSLAETGCGDVT